MTVDPFAEAVGKIEEVEDTLADYGMDDVRQKLTEARSDLVDERIDELVDGGLEDDTRTRTRGDPWPILGYDIRTLTGEDPRPDVQDSGGEPAWAFPLITGMVLLLAAVVADLIGHPEISEVALWLIVVPVAIVVAIAVGLVVLVLAALVVFAIAAPIAMVVDWLRGY